MEENKISIRQYILYFGLLLGIVTTVFSLMLFFLDMHYQNSPFELIVFLLILSASVVIAFIAFKKDNGGVLNLSECFKIGLGISLISSIIMFLYTLIEINFLDPETKTKGLNFVEETMKMNNPELSQENIDIIIERLKNMSSPRTIFISTIAIHLFFGFIISLIGGLIVKKSRPE